MFKKEAQRLENSIVLSIQYSRMLEEISDTNLKIDVAHGKKIVLAKGNQICDYENYINNVNEKINEIRKMPKQRYSIIENNELKEKLQILSTRKDYETIKYNIAIRTVLDRSVDYKNTDDYLEKISEIIFNDKTKIKQIENELEDIYCYLTDTTKKEIKKEVGGIVQKVALPILKDPKKLAKMVKGKHKIIIAVAVVGALVAGGSIISRISKTKKTVKSFKKIEAEDLEYILMTYALCLKVANSYMDEVEYYKYFKRKMKIINILKNKIDKELFEKWYEAKENSQKIMLLNKFDEYLINKIGFAK